MRMSSADAVSRLERPCRRANRRENGARMRRFVTAVFKHETNTFSSIPTTSDYGLLPSKNVRRPIYPLDADTESNLR